jgi:hypothetical protein
MINSIQVPIQEFNGKFRLEVLEPNCGWTVQFYAVRYKNNFSKLLTIARNYNTWRIVRPDGIIIASQEGVLND